MGFYISYENCICNKEAGKAIKNFKDQVDAVDMK